MRILAAYFPAFPLQVTARATPGLRKGAQGGRPPPFAVAEAMVSGQGREAPAGANLLCVSSAARRAGVREGMTVTQARALCSELIVRPVDPAAREVARIAIAEVLSGFGPVVEVVEEWSAGFVDLTGERDEEGMARAAGPALARAGFIARIAVAGNRFTARALAEYRGTSGTRPEARRGIRESGQPERHTVVRGRSPEKPESRATPRESANAREGSGEFPRGSANAREGSGEFPRGSANAREGTGEFPRGSANARIVPPGAERVALANVSLEVLSFVRGGRPRAGPPRTLAADPIAAFRRLGWTTLDDVARLPADALARRFGAAAAGLSALARGEDPTPLTPFRLPEALFEKVDLPVPAAALEPLLFSLKTLLDRTCARLSGRGRAAARLAVHLVLEEWDRAAPAVTVDLRLPRPTLAVKSILEVARERMARLDLPGPVAEMAVELVESVPTRKTQLDLFSRAPPSPEKLAITLGRLTTAFGPDAVFAADLADEHRPERAFCTGTLEGMEFAAEHSGEGRGGVLPGEVRSPGRGRGSPLPGEVRPSGEARALPERPMRLLASPEPVRMLPRQRDGGPELVVRGRRLAVVGMEGPERLSGEWWEQAFDRDYWKVRTEEGSEWWIFHDRTGDAWHLHGCFD